MNEMSYECLAMDCEADDACPEDKPVCLYKYDQCLGYRPCQQFECHEN